MRLHNRLAEFLRKYHADLALFIIVSIWGLHYIVVKDAFSHVSPLAYNAIRFPIGLPIISLPLLRNRRLLHIKRQDFWMLLRWAMLGLVGYQVLFVLGLDRTTATNSALLVSTLPAWVAIISVSMGLMVSSRRLTVGIVVTLLGVVLIVMNRPDDGLSLSSDDMIGSLMILVGVMFSAIYTIKVVSIVERYGSLTVAILTHWITCFGMLVIGAPSLVKLSPSDLSASVIPNILYSGLLASACGYLVWNYALSQLGATRTATYNNISPLVAAFAGIVLLGEHLTTLLVLGGAMTLIGVVLVRGSGSKRPAQTFKQRIDVRVTAEVAPVGD